MATSSDEKQFADYVVDLMQTIGPVSARRMFGGYGIFHQGLMFALIADGSLYLKADDQTREWFLAEDCEPFSYYKKDKEYRLSYYLVPEEFFEDPDACLRWARLAFDAALRDPGNKSKRQKA